MTIAHIFSDTCESVNDSKKFAKVFEPNVTEISRSAIKFNYLLIYSVL